MHELTLLLNDSDLDRIAAHLKADGLGLYSDATLLGASLANACAENIEREALMQREDRAIRSTTSTGFGDYPQGGRSGGV